LLATILNQLVQPTHVTLSGP
jgi:hypothetical protein